MRHGLGVAAAIWGLMLAAGVGLAQDGVEGQLDCTAAETQADVNACAKLDFDDADSNLNGAYKAAVARMKDMDASGADTGADTGAEAALREAQRAWVAFRDLACASEGWTVRGGSLEPLVVLQCMARLSGARADDLWAMSEEGGG